MTHDSAVRIVVKMVPEIEKKGAEAVLTDYAKKEDLPPAQLEKLAQVLNTLMTVSHIEKAADRGSSTYLVDVPTLVTSYAIGHEPTKAARAAVSHDTSHDIATVDLLTAMRQAVAGPKPVREIEKAAYVAVEKTFTHQDLADAALELEVESMLALEKLASSILRTARGVNGVVDLALAEEEACHSLDSHWVKKACDWLQGNVKNTVFLRHDHTQALTKRAFAAGVRNGKSLVEFVHAFVTRDLMLKAAMYIGDEPNPGNTVTLDDNLNALIQARLSANTEGKQKAQEESERNAVGADDEYEGDDDAPRAPREAKPKSERRNDERSDNEPRQSGGGKNKSSKGDSESTESPARFLKTIGGAAMVPVRGTAEVINNTAAAADRLIGNITSKERSHSAQKYTDVSVEDIRRSINLSRMIGTDPVLREADPRQVLEVYNAIARANPELASNMPSLKLLLREAVSYEGLTLDAQKQLADIRKSTSESESKEQENDKRRYSTGGAAQIFKSKA